MKLIILDRDGVINEETGHYVKSPEEWVAIPGSIDAIARLCRSDYRVVIATNQSGIGRGLFSVEMMTKIHSGFLAEVEHKGGNIDAIFYCPHHPDENCACRKPRPGLFNEISSRLKISLTGVPAVGDSLRDLHAAREAGAFPILVLSGKNEMKLADDTEYFVDEELGEIPVFRNLSAVAEALLGDGPPLISGRTVV